MPTRTPVPTQHQPEVPPATVPQLDYLSSLLDQREIPDKEGQPGADRRAKARGMIDRGEFNLETAKNTISWLLTLPPRQQELPKPDNWQHKVEPGRYAVEHDGTLKFYRVNIPSEGRWKGYTFVKVQASDELHRIRGKMAQEVLALIEAEPHEAMARYGQELGQCGRCGRTLTDETSRQLGIGPVCREEMNND